jgi:small subunit ribosomal protein S4
MKRAKPGTSRADKKLSTYGIQLLEKQRLRTYYGVLEKQFERYVNEAKKMPGQTGEALVNILECRLDNLVYRMGAATSIRQARQMVVHGHILLNSKKVNRPSHPVKTGDVVALSDKAKNMPLFVENFDSASLNTLPYLQKDLDNKAAVLSRLPERSEIPIEINDHLIVEYYSK